MTSIEPSVDNADGATYQIEQSYENFRTGENWTRLLPKRTNARVIEVPNER